MIQSILESFQVKSPYRPYRSVYLVEKEPGYVLKPLNVGAARAYLTGLLLSNHDKCPIISRLIQPKTGGYYLWNHGNRYLLMEKIEGRAADYMEINDLKATIAGMKDFHQFSRLLLDEKCRLWPLLKFDPVAEWLKRLFEMEICREIAIRSQNDSFSRQYLKIWHKFYDLAFQAIQTIQRVSSGEVTICYHDWAYHNVIIRQGKAHLIDFDYMLIDNPVHDRVNLISRYLRLHQWSVNSLLRILWNFDHLYPWRKEDLKLLIIYLTFPYDYWILGRQYFLEKQPWSKKYFQDQWNRKISYHQERLKALDVLGKIC